MAELSHFTPHCTIYYNIPVNSIKSRKGVGVRPCYKRIKIGLSLVCAKLMSIGLILSFDFTLRFKI